MKAQINKIVIQTLFLVILVVVVTIPVNTQAQQISFGKEYWNVEYHDTYGESLIQMHNGEYILIGNDVEFSPRKTVLIHIDSMGEIIQNSLIEAEPWTNTESIYEMNSYLLLLCGTTWNFSTSSGGAFIQKRDLNDSIYNQIVYNNISYYNAGDLQMTNEGSYIFCGHALNTNLSMYDGYINMVDSNGILLWQAIINDGIDTTHECINKVCQLTDGSFMATGWSRSNATMNLPYNLFVAHVSADGQVLNTRVYLPRYSGYSNSGRGICPTSDGNALVLSHEMPGPGLSWQICLYKITPQCDTLWTKFVPGPVGYGSSGSDMRKTSDGGFLIAGSAYLDYKPYAMIARLDGEGNQIWAEAHANGNSMTFMVNVTETLDKGAAAIGRTYKAGGDHIYFLKTDTLGLVTGRQDVLPLSNDLHISPNPAKHSCRLQFMSGTHLIQLFDLQGRLVLNQNIKQGQTSADISLTHLPPGIYLIHLHSANNKQVKKLVKI